MGAPSLQHTIDVRHLLSCLLHQVVPLPFGEEEEQQQQAASVAVCPMHGVVMAAQAAAGAAGLQPFAVRLLPYRAYAVVLEARYV